MPTFTAANPTRVDALVTAGGGPVGFSGDTFLEATADVVAAATRIGTAARTDLVVVGEWSERGVIAALDDELHGGLAVRAFTPRAVATERDALRGRVVAIVSVLPQLVSRTGGPMRDALATAAHVVYVDAPSNRGLLSGR